MEAYVQCVEEDDQIRVESGIPSLIYVACDPLIERGRCEDHDQQPNK